MGWGQLGLSLDVRRDSRGRPTDRSAPLPPDHSGVLLHRGFQQPLQDGPFPHRCASGGSRQRQGSTGHVPALGPSLGRTSPRGANCPPIKEANKFFFKKIHESPFPFIVLKRGKWGKKSKRAPTDGTAGKVRRAGTISGAVWGSGLEPAGARARGGAGMATCRSPSFHPRERALGATHPGGWGPGKGPGTSPRTWHFSGTGRCRTATCEAGAERAEQAAGLGNPLPPPLIPP